LRASFSSKTTGGRGFWAGYNQGANAGTVEAF
jgi:hypothetical protein